MILCSNHDFDHGVPRLEDLASKCNFPWLISNVWDRTTGGTLGNGHEWLVLEWQGYRIGLMGLIESEWLETLATVSTDHIRYESFVDVGRKLARLLRTEQKVDFVIALTHMRVPNDELLAKSVPELDLILGGHEYGHSLLSFYKFIYLFFFIYLFKKKTACSATTISALSTGA